MASQRLFHLQKNLPLNVTPSLLEKEFKKFNTIFEFSASWCQFYYESCFRIFCVLVVFHLNGTHNSPNISFVFCCGIRQDSGVLGHFINFENVYQILLTFSIVFKFIFSSVLLMAALPNFPIVCVNFPCSFSLPYWIRIFFF